jgi:hypothetical protein
MNEASEGNKIRSFKLLSVSCPLRLLSIVTSSISFVIRFFQMKCRSSSSLLDRMMAPFVGLGSTKFAPSRRNARPALRASSSVITRRQNVERRTRRRVRWCPRGSLTVFSSCHRTIMSYSGFDEPTAWDPPAGDLVKDALRKEQLLKWVNVLCTSTRLLLTTSTEILLQGRTTFVVCF